MASPNLNEIVTTTLRDRSGSLADNFSNNNALIARMKKKGSIKPVSGGRTIVQELAYAQNGTYQRYAGYQTLNIQPSDVFTAAEFDWKQAAVAVTWNGLEIDVQNTGAAQVIDLLESRIENAEKTFINQLSFDMYSNGTADGGLQMGGLQLLVADTATSGVVGGIDRAAWPFWRNQVFSGTTNGGGAVSATTIQNYMNQLWLGTKRNTDVTDLIIADNKYVNSYWQSLQAIQRITQTDNGQAGYQTLKYMGADVVADGAIGAACPANHMYFLNTDYLKYRPSSKRNMVPLETVTSINQDASVKLIVWAGNLALSNAQLQGVLVA
jgi:archaellum component FlaF (FlaF/FlaG flagellin family)